MTAPSYTLSVLRDGTDSAVVELRWFQDIEGAVADEIGRHLKRHGAELLHNPVGSGWLLRCGAAHTTCANPLSGELKMTVPDLFSGRTSAAGGVMIAPFQSTTTASFRRPGQWYWHVENTSDHDGPGEIVECGYATDEDGAATAALAALTRARKASYVRGAACVTSSRESRSQCLQHA